jgi:two-component sensor histidine kinase
MLIPTLSRNILILLVAFITTSGIAQYSFVNYDHTNGLPLDEVKVIVEDKKGYLWLGGPLGLSRFDGVRFSHYYLGSSNYNVAGNIVEDIKVTPSGEVVAVYEDNGISIYNHQTDSFRSKKYSVSDSSSFPQYSILFLYIENDTSAYIGANREGLYHINLRTLESEKIPVNIKPNGMYPDPDNDSSYLITRGGLHRLDMNNLKLEKLTSAGFSGIDVIGRDVWYNGYTSYIFKYNLDSGNEKRFDLDERNVVRGWTFVDQNLWIGTPEGIELIDTASAQVTAKITAGINIHDFQGSFVYDIYKDSKGRVWVAHDGGISIYDPSNQYFKRATFLSSESIDLSILDAQNYLSLDFYHNKVFRIGKKGNETEVDINGDLKGPVKFVSFQNKSLIMFFNGIAEYHEINNTLSEFPSPFTKSKKRGLIDLFISEEKWLGIYRYQNILVSWNTSTSKLDTISFNNEPRGILPVNEKEVLIYGVNLICIYDLESGKSRELDLSKNEYSSLGADIVKIDKIGNNYWISTRINGIFRGRFKSGEIILDKHYKESDGLINNKVVETYLDEYGNFFVQCRSNIFMLDKEKDRFFTLGGANDVNFQVTHGLIAIDSIVYALGYKSKSLDLRQVDTSSRQWNTNIQCVSISGRENCVDSNVASNLDYDENNISISFSTIEFSDLINISHKYRLESTADWIYLDPGSRNIQLTSMAAGDYLLQLSASSGNGLWSKPIEWEFSIKPPFWKTGWFLAVSLLLLGGLGYLIYSLRLNQINKVNKMKVQLAELESESLRAQMNPHFVFNALNSIKSYIIKNNKEEAADYLTTFSELIRAVLRNSTRKEISLKDEIEALSLYLQIENLRLNQKFDFNIDVAKDINAATIAFPPLIIQPFVENSIWHGFTNKKTRGLLNIKVFREKSQLIIEVEDDGIGRGASKKIEKSRGRKRSYGIAITKTRLHNIMDQADIEIEDLYDDSGKSSGTKVIIHLPFNLLENANEKDVKY